eukprot:363868-Chlamydomonas_euryale.AAC.4
MFDGPRSNPRPSRSFAATLAANPVICSTASPVFRSTRNGILRKPAVRHPHNLFRTGVLLFERPVTRQEQRHSRSNAAAKEARGCGIARSKACGPAGRRTCVLLKGEGGR